jgi:hypothetical protein
VPCTFLLLQHSSPPLVATKLYSRPSSTFKLVDCAPELLSSLQPHASTLRHRGKGLEHTYSFSSTNRSRHLSCPHLYTYTMTFDLWTYQFCLACDKQVQSDSATYCSEPCQMIDFERATLPPNSQVSSPGFPPPPTKFSVSWAYGLSTARSCEITPQQRPWIDYIVPGTEQVSSFVTTQNLKHANSHSSLGSMQSTSSTDKADGLTSQHCCDVLRSADILHHVFVYPKWRPKGDREVYVTSENASHPKFARRATHNHHTYLITQTLLGVFRCNKMV